ncbi:hypothetical protein BW730_04885 [Tessaracoccus aquimaris]|uniref:DUF1707 domain-containing protein n=1 Tax=Tessaracoccus aquimaris TaxID=1332264 RepID=A0A1Q2CLK4_9ACTN|nr:DUF1707 domain-containing protein [Tessaracoccus aquimaris]AQP46955.1 hypothetical protein BW730_04885 [Tessaracoccus aquimaris]
MSVPGQSPFNGVSDELRDRAVAHLSAMYGNGTINETELDRRLGLALGARDRIELGRSLAGLARMAPAVLTPKTPGGATPVENVGAGLVQLSGLATSFVGPAIVKAATKPGSRLWWEAGRAMSLQLTFLAIGLALTVLGWMFHVEALVFLAWAAWWGSTIWASVRAFNGKRSTGNVEPFLLARPKLPGSTTPGITR